MRNAITRVALKRLQKVRDATTQVLRGEFGVPKPNGLRVARAGSTPKLPLRRRRLHSCPRMGLALQRTKRMEPLVMAT
jgi:hypothetical protein